MRAYKLEINGEDFGTWASIENITRILHHKGIPISFAYNDVTIDFDDIFEYWAESYGGLFRGMKDGQITGEQVYIQHV